VIVSEKLTGEETHESLVPLAEGHGKNGPLNAVKLSILVVAWNVRKQLTDCLRSIERYPPAAAFEVIVVDNDSVDGTAEAVRGDFPWVTVLANEQNCGFAAANNRAVAHAQGEYLLLLNPDTLVHPGGLDVLCEFLDRNGDVAVCGPRLLNENGTIQPSVRGVPSFRAVFYRYTIFRHVFLFRRQHREWLRSGFPYDRQADADQLMGAALMLRRAALNQVGLLDERFFLYYEEVDLCHRLRRAGWRAVFVPDATITHLGGQSSRQVPVAARIMMLESLLGYFRKHRGKIATGLFTCLFKPGVLAKWLCDLVVAAILYVISWLTFDRARRRKSAATIKNTALLLVRHSWWLLFRA
jgi:N-acetylglucosaminyl-diphospho-decaprenol L-rhamnosyltransferase